MQSIMAWQRSGNEKEEGFGLVWVGLVWFYGIATVVGYFMPNPLLYI